MYQRSGRPVRTLSSLSALVASQNSISRKSSTRGGVVSDSGGANQIESSTFSFGTKLTIGAIAATSVCAAFLKYSRKKGKSTNSTKKNRKSILMKGLPNVTGNLCFLNALLQALACVPSFLRYLEEKTEEPKTTPFTASLSSCLKDLNEPSGSSISNKIYAVLNNLRDVMVRRGMKMNEQNDVQELYHVFMDLIETESDRNMKQQSKPLLPNHRPQHVFSPISIVDEKPEEEEEIVLMSENKSKRNPMIGLMASLLRCQHCGHIAPIKLTPFNDVSVDLVSSSSSFSSTRLHAGTTFRDDDSHVVGVERSFGCKSPCHGLETLFKDEQSFRHSPLLSLTNENQATSSSITLRDCLKHFTSAEVLRSVECERCKTETELRESHSSCSKELETKLRHLDIENELRNSLQKQYWKNEIDSEGMNSSQSGRILCTSPRPPALRQDALSRLPVVLCVHIRRRQFCRSTSRLLKVNGHVRFDLILHVDSFCDRTIVGTQLIPYRLVSVIVHHGCFGDGGHFTTYRRCVVNDDEEVWLCCDDEKVHVVDAKEVLRSEAYMLFYEQIL